MYTKKQPQNLHLLPTNGALWLRSLVTASIGCVCLFFLIPLMQPVLSNPEYWVGYGSGDLQARVFVCIVIFAPVFFLVNGLVTILNKNLTKRNVKRWGDVVVEDEDTHFQV